MGSVLHLSFKQLLNICFNLRNITEISSTHLGAHRHAWVKIISHLRYRNNYLSKIRLEDHLIFNDVSKSTLHTEVNTEIWESLGNLQRKEMIIVIFLYYLHNAWIMRDSNNQCLEITVY